MSDPTYFFAPIGVVRSSLRSAKAAPKQGSEGAPTAWIELDSRFAEAVLGLTIGDQLILLTWLHEARRDLQLVHPRDDLSAPLKGVFATRSADRPNPIGLHPVILLAVEGLRLNVGPLEAIDGTPVLDLKPAL
ncbi:tRNA (N6-threonylcarbamoyladenosine(37)-N6)-methyltransferase TrmO [Polaromonas sp. A23]|uniref:tRNA (N6-threonylcarbamoyladenosine(37)-N6)-methyltransferase TrmO n=1 Tax=Polaromonas sp. A23 TaxID=1944133 RepID=UPI0009850762|nr:tRNA (N6-threonylcarbamoyladenosine(37)-N6)-methyltransferase TrmO [Polaromonas sp. A23]OOG39462.1 tRNA (N6-threonylcarbamoyladenosine(37)-N6)-methyltransferase TrmO [Polaromonas sp. A23]